MGRKFSFKRLFLWFFSIFLGFFIFSVSSVIILKYINPPVTLAQVVRLFEGFFDGKFIGITKNWKSYDEISPHVFRAIIASEDKKFLRHDGFDWRAIEAAKRYNAIHKGKKLRGASTISMQTAKNAFLWHSRNYLRKGLEAYFTVLIEFFWSKKRILEMYVNVIEFGEGIYGIEAAAQTYFNKSAKDLTKREAALIAACLPNPRKRSPKNPTPYIQSRANSIMGRMNSIALPKD